MFTDEYNVDVSCWRFPINHYDDSYTMCVCVCLMLESFCLSTRIECDESPLVSKGKSIINETFIINETLSRQYLWREQVVDVWCFMNSGDTVFVINSLSISFLWLKQGGRQSKYSPATFLKIFQKIWYFIFFFSISNFFQPFARSWPFVVSFVYFVLRILKIREGCPSGHHQELR